MFYQQPSSPHNSHTHTCSSRTFTINYQLELQVPLLLPQLKGMRDDASRWDSRNLREKMSTLSKNLEAQLNGEALEALEESLKTQNAVILERKAHNEDMKSRVIDKYQRHAADAMSKLTEINHRCETLNDGARSVIAERDQAMQDLRNVELAFSDVHRKYERAKTVIENLKLNEDLLKQRDEEIMLLIDSRDQKYEAFKQEAHQTMERMYHDFHMKLSGLDADNARLTAQLRRTEMRVETFESELEHKQKENAQLNTLADELIGKNTGNC